MNCNYLFCYTVIGLLLLNVCTNIYVTSSHGVRPYLNGDLRDTMVAGFVLMFDQRLPQRPGVSFSTLTAWADVHAIDHWN